MGLTSRLHRRGALALLGAGLCSAGAAAQTDEPEIDEAPLPRRSKPKPAGAKAKLPARNEGEAPSPPSRAAAGGGRTRLVSFEASPFPYRGEVPEGGKDFLDVRGENGRRGHTSPRGGVVWEDPSYLDRRSLLSIPAGFDPSKPAAMIVFFHGNQATLDRDVRARQRVPKQVEASGLNAVLVAPQFAVNVLDSSAGRFWERGFFGEYLVEAGGRLSELWGDPGSQAAFNAMPVIVVAYSGGYLPAAFALDRGGADDRVRGVLLLDAIYAETDKFAEWVARRRSASFFVSAFSGSTRPENQRLQRMLDERRVAYSRDLPASLGPGAVALVSAGEVTHNDFVTRALAGDPLASLLSRVAIASRTGEVKARRARL